MPVFYNKNDNALFEVGEKNSFITNVSQLITIQSNLSNILKMKRTKEKEIICIFSSYTANPSNLLSFS